MRGEDLIGWHLDRGLDTAPEFYGASRFRELFYRPDVIAHVLSTLDNREALRLADQASGQQTRPRDIRTVLPPRVTILSPAPVPWPRRPNWPSSIKAESDVGPITATEVGRDFLSKVAGKVVLFLDTWHSGQMRPGKGQTDALPDITKFANDLADAEAKAETGRSDHASAVGLVWWETCQIAMVSAGL